jgi:hypothetical protein
MRKDAVSFFVIFLILKMFLDKTLENQKRKNRSNVYTMTKMGKDNIKEKTFSIP